MVAEQTEKVEIRDDFYRDGFTKITAIIISIGLAIAMLVGISIYLYSTKPKPVAFPVLPEWRIQGDVPLDQSYVTTPDLLQWVSDAIPKAFIYDFYHYNDQIKEASRYFTTEGWKGFLDQVNTYANYNNVQANKLFVNASPIGAPFILQEGLFSGRYAWWVQMPIEISYAGFRPPLKRNLTLQILVVRVPTLNNLSGLGINNVIVAK